MSSNTRSDEHDLFRAILLALYQRARQLPPRPGPPVPLGALFDEATVIHKLGLTLVYAPGAAQLGNLIMSHSENGAGTDDFGNQYQGGDKAYRDAFIRSTPGGHMGNLVPEDSSDRQ